MTEKPLLLIDVDGPLNPWASSGNQLRKGRQFHRYKLLGCPVWLNRWHGEHEYCQKETGLCRWKILGVCKFRPRAFARATGKRKSDMNGDFGVFDGVILLARFGTDDDAEAYRREVLELDRPEGWRRSAFNEYEVFVTEVPEEHDEMVRLLQALKESRRRDLCAARRAGADAAA